ncbi:hypothetical protein [Streptomyces sp. CB01881]|uniref:DUF7848 domain-containing protein n=1 Tax=Streptomyces sp. CB01881 TaxID=2078691 RepID=UPI000CDC413E|nr:hypothetical protein [Streptomyces sp. CB01881]AUY52309.1 hypothetical protein C2142_29090 [Streptomyces sp. CB01881]TYC71731.1 hypothetical protein EH183_29070 [Streptomyces sp. CB01881]
MSLGTLPRREIGVRRIFRFLNWTIRQDHDRKAVHLFYCEGEEEDGTRCRADSGELTDLEAAREWTFTHLKERQDHRSFGQLAYVPMEMVPEQAPE